MRELKKHIGENNLTYFIETYGCQMNSHESEKIAGVLESLGYLPAGDKNNANLLMYNTCCIRQHAEAKLNSNIGALKDYKNSVKGAVIAVCGCMMQQEGAAKKLMNRFPFVDMAFGTNAIHRLGQMLSAVLLDGKRAVATDEDETIIEGIPVKRAKKAGAYVNIIYGCDNFCSYCVVPYVRGRERSRNVNDILAEINQLCGKGITEITLLGQNVNSYSDGTKDGGAFARLIRRIDKETDIKRVRFMTSHPKDMSADLIECFGGVQSLCEHIHLPVQSGSSRVLSAMNRGYSRERYLDLLYRLKERVPYLAVTTDIIVGFPGETDEDFELTLSLVKEARFDAAYTFAYSPRKMTKAAAMQNQLSNRVKSERLEVLNKLIKDIMRQKNNEYLGKTVEVLADSVSKRSYNEISGRTRTAKTVNITGTKEDIGKYINVTVDKVMAHTLKGIRA